MTRNILYVTWDGPGADHLLGLFAPILSKICATTSANITVLQVLFREEDIDDRSAFLSRKFGLRYVPVQIAPVSRSQRPLVWLLRKARGVVTAYETLRREIRSLDPDVVVFRNVVPGLLMLGLSRRLRRVRTVYDCDGLAADIRRDVEGWNRPSATAIGWIEDRAVRTADRVLVRTPWAAHELESRNGLAQGSCVVVSNGRDPDEYRPASTRRRIQIREELGIPADAFVMMYVGSSAPRQRPRTVAALVAEHVGSGSKNFAVLLTFDVDEFRQLLLEHVDNASLHRIRIKSASPTEVAPLISAGDVGIACQVASRGTRSVAIVKVGEYLLSGLPVVTERHASPHVDELVQRGVAVVLDELSPFERRTWLSAARDDRAMFEGRARLAGLDYFSVERSVREYLDAIFDLRHLAASDGGDFA